MAEKPTYRPPDHEPGVNLSDIAELSYSPSHLGELYWNFGWPGVVIGMLAIGFVLGIVGIRCDMTAGPTMTKLLIAVITVRQLMQGFEGELAVAYCRLGPLRGAVLVMHLLLARPVKPETLPQHARGARPEGGFAGNAPALGAVARFRICCADARFGRMRDACAICGFDSLASLGRIPAIEQARISTTWNASNAASAARIPASPIKRIYDAVYANVHRVPGNARYAELAADIARAKDPLDYIANAEECYYAVCKSLTQVGSSNGELYKVGCGQGYLTYALARAGYDITGVDISPQAVALATKRYGAHYHCGDLRALIKARGRRPACIVATELIEHLTDPVAFVADLVELLAPAGSLIVTTPNKLEIGRPIWDTDLPPVHLWWFTRTALGHIAERVGCEIAFTELGDYYRRHITHRRAATDSTGGRTPILNERYQLIRAAAQERALDRIKSKARNSVPRALVQAYKRIRWSFSNMNRVDHATAGTLCAVYTKGPPGR